MHKTYRFSLLPFCAQAQSPFTTITFLFLVSLAFCEGAVAQNAQLRPVARLISDSTAEVNSRPRKVSLATESLASAPARPTSPSFEDATAIERNAFEKTNESRVKNGFAPVVWDAELCLMAREHSESMARHGFFSHETLEGLQLKDRARLRGIGRFRVIAENIAYNKGYEDPGAFAVERWMISNGHRANILYIGFQAAAIGTYVAADGSVYLTQIFIAR